MGLKEKEIRLENIYLQYFRKHHNAIYFGLGILFLLQLIILASSTIQINKINSKVSDNNILLNQQIENISSSMNQSLNQIQRLLSNYQEVQDKITKDLELLKLSSDFTLIAEKSLKSTISINAYNQDYTSGFLGAGFFVSPGGYAITNYHVIKYMSYVDIITNSEETYRAKVIGYDEFKDVALLKVELNTTYLELENSDNVQVGEKVIAIGNPLGLESSITQGVVSGLKRQGDNNLQAYIQTDVSINPGNSGGPLINSKGKVIGINTFKYVDASVEGMGFALESNEIKATVNKIAGFTLIE